MDDTKAPAEERLAALESLVAAKDASLVDSLLKLVQRDGVKGELREAAIRGLAQYDDARVGPELVAAYAKLTSGERRSAIATLSSRAPSAIALLKAIQAQED